MTTLEKIKKKIEKMQELTEGEIKQIVINKKEATEIGNVNMIKGVKLIVIEEKKDCFAYHKEIGKFCYGLNGTPCKKGICKFYKKETPETNIESIEKDIVKYEKSREIKGVSLR